MIERQAANGYAGDVMPREAWRVLAADPAAVLIDVRSVAEWTFVGLPDLSQLEKSVQCVEWQRFPGMDRVTDFVDIAVSKLNALGAGTDTPLFFLCRSGVRSAASAQILTGLGYSAAHNVSGGFEGDKDRQGHRGGVCGWKFDGLPWAQG